MMAVDEIRLAYELPNATRRERELFESVLREHGFEPVSSAFPQDACSNGLLSSGPVWRCPARPEGRVETIIDEAASEVTGPAICSFRQVKAQESVCRTVYGTC